LTDAEKVAEVARILDSALPTEQKLIAVRRILHIETSRQNGPSLSTTWHRDDDPEFGGRISHPRPTLWGRARPADTEL
jgi:hypothetical protein